VIETASRRGRRAPIRRGGIAYPINDYDPDYFFNDCVPAIARLQELLGR
jgi:hypothetical protein